MNRYRRYLPHLVAALVGGAMLGAPATARADLEIFLQEAGVNGGKITMVGSGPSFTAASYTGTYGDFSVSIQGGSSDNGATLSDILSSTTSVKNLNLQTAGAHTLNIWVSQDGYSLPAGSPLNVESGLGGSISSGTLDLANIFQAYADKNNDMLTQTVTGGAATTDFTNGSQSAMQNGSTILTGSAFGLFNRIGAYSLTTVTAFDLSAGGNANFSAHENLTAAPAPAGLVLALTGLPVLSIGRLIRRRKAA